MSRFDYDFDSTAFQILKYVFIFFADFLYRMGATVIFLLVIFCGFHEDNSQFSLA
jgi:hypothetical protein